MFSVWGGERSNVSDSDSRFPAQLWNPISYLRTNKCTVKACNPPETACEQIHSQPICTELAYRQQTIPINQSQST